ncbi:MAG: DoxX family protein [Acidobacteriaceae bacterium]
MLKLAILFQVVVAFSVVYVWILRLPNIEKEFRDYGLPNIVRNAVGASKISLATLLIVGIWYPSLVLVPAGLMAFLMLCAQAFHLKARHPWQKFVPSLVLLLLSLFVVAVHLGKVTV